LRLKTDEWMKTVCGHTSTSGDLLYREASQARVFQFCLKTGGGAMTSGARDIIVEVT
jgi:predicted kinase